MKKVIITGGAGFIGSALIRHLIKATDWQVLNLDKLTYAGCLESLNEVSGSPRYGFVQADNCDRSSVEKIFAEFRPDAIMHLAAESHVDRSIDGPMEFIQTNIVGTATLLQAAREYWTTLEETAKNSFRFQHISTDEVYGALQLDGGFFTENNKYDPHSPYSASKASSDHFVRAYHDTYGLPVVISNCSNNYGANQFPEKLIPLSINNIKHNKTIPIYGKVKTSGTGCG